MEWRRAEEEWIESVLKKANNGILFDGVGCMRDPLPPFSRRHVIKRSYANNANSRRGELVEKKKCSLQGSNGIWDWWFRSRGGENIEQ